MVSTGKPHILHWTESRNLNRWLHSGWRSCCLLHLLEYGVGASWSRFIKKKKKGNCTGLSESVFVICDRLEATPFFVGGDGATNVFAAAHSSTYFPLHLSPRSTYVFGRRNGWNRFHIPRRFRQPQFAGLYFSRRGYHKRDNLLTRKKSAYLHALTVFDNGKSRFREALECTFRFRYHCRQQCGHGFPFAYGVRFGKIVIVIWQSLKNMSDLLMVQSNPSRTRLKSVMQAKKYGLCSGWRCSFCSGAIPVRPHIKLNRFLKGSDAVILHDRHKNEKVMKEDTFHCLRSPPL